MYEIKFSIDIDWQGMNSGEKKPTLKDVECFIVLTRLEREILSLWNVEIIFGGKNLNLAQHKYPMCSFNFYFRGFWGGKKKQNIFFLVKKLLEYQTQYKIYKKLAVPLSIAWSCKKLIQTLNLYDFKSLIQIYLKYVPVDCAKNFNNFIKTIIRNKN